MTAPHSRLDQAANQPAASGLQVTPSTADQVDPAAVFCASAPDMQRCLLFADRLRTNQASLDRGE